MVIAEQTDDNQTKILKKERIAIRLGADAFEHGLFTEETLLASVEVFRKFAILHKKYKVKRYIACATSAMRESKNSQKLIDLVSKKTKIKINVISGQEEGLLIREAVAQEIRLQNTKTCFIDIGGGSVEITFNKNHQKIATQSFPIGTVRSLQIRKTVHTNDNLRLYKKIIEPYIKKQLKQTGSLNFAVGTGGNIETLGRLRAQILKKTPNTRLCLEDLEKIHRTLRALNISERIAKYQLRPDRADVIMPALEVLILIMKLVKIKELKVPYTGLREGLLLRLSRTKSL